MQIGKVTLTKPVLIGYLTTVALIIASVTPVLPATTPQWVHDAMLVIAAIVGALSQSILKIPPTVPEAVAVIEATPSISVIKVGGTPSTDAARETLPPTGPGQ